MGLLDALFSGDSGSGGGILDFLRANAMAQQAPAGLPSDQAQYGAAPSMFAQGPQPAPMMGASARAPMATPPQAPAPMPPPQPPAVIAAPPAPASPAPGGQSFGGNLMAGFANLESGGNPISALANVVDGFATGQRHDRAGVEQQQLAKQMGFAATALQQKGAPLADIQAGVNNPEVMKALIAKYYPANQAVTSLGDGWVTDKNGEVRRAYTPEQKDNFSIVQTGEDAMGNKTFSKMNKATGEQTPVEGAPSAAGAGLGDMSKTGTEYLATLPPLQQKIVAGMIDGTVQPPSSFALAKKSWQAMLAAAKNVDPSFDENTWTSRHKMTGDIAASGNSSMGGILSNGKSSFKHLAEYTDSAADLGNASHNFIGGGGIAHAQNYVGNKLLSGSDTDAKIGAINDNLGKYGTESTKFYAGTGGGVEERMNALKEMNPVTKSSEEMASYAAKEKNLMLDRFREKEKQIRDVMGPAYLEKHPVFDAELQKDIDRIDANVAKLRGHGAASAKLAPGQSTTIGGVSIKRVN